MSDPCKTAFEQHYPPQRGEAPVGAPHAFKLGWNAAMERLRDDEQREPTGDEMEAARWIASARHLLTVIKHEVKTKGNMQLLDELLATPWPDRRDWDDLLIETLAENTRQATGEDVDTELAAAMIPPSMRAALEQTISVEGMDPDDHEDQVRYAQLHGGYGTDYPNLPSILATHPDLPPIGEPLTRVLDPAKAVPLPLGCCWHTYHTDGNFHLLLSYCCYCEREVKTREREVPDPDHGPHAPKITEWDESQLPVDPCPKRT